MDQEDVKNRFELNFRGFSLLQKCMRKSQRSLIGHPGAIFFYEVTRHLQFDLFTSSRPLNQLTMDHTGKWGDSLGESGNWLSWWRRTRTLCTQKAGTDRRRCTSLLQLEPLHRFRLDAFEEMENALPEQSCGVLVIGRQTRVDKQVLVSGIKV